MTVYIDLLFAVNTLINYLLLRGSAAMGGTPGIPGRLLTAAALGGIYAVATVLPGMMWLCRLPVQALSAGLMLLVAFGWKKNTVKQGLFFFALSFAFSGAVLLLVQTVEPDCLYLGGRAYYAVSMSALLLLAGLGYAVAALVLRGWGTHTGGDIVPLVLELGGRRVTVRALRDTGNTLRDPMTGRAVLVASGELLEKLVPQIKVTEAQLCEPGKLARAYPEIRFHLVPYHTVGIDRGVLLAVRCQVCQGKHRQLILTAFSPTKVSADGRFDALWGGNLA